MNILSKIFEKRGIKDASELDTEEREDFERYRAILAKPDISIQDITQFLETQIKVIEAKWKDYAMENKADLIPYHTIYRALADIIKSPQVEREQLEQYLIALHKL